MSKKIYKLSDIEKILTYTPPIFFIFLTIDLWYGIDLYMLWVKLICNRVLKHTNTN